MIQSVVSPHEINADAHVLLIFHVVEGVGVLSDLRKNDVYIIAGACCDRPAMLYEIRVYLLNL